MVKWTLPHFVTRAKPAAKSSQEESDDERNPKYHDVVHESCALQQYDAPQQQYYATQCAAAIPIQPRFTGCITACVPVLGVHPPDISNDNTMVKRVWASSGPKWRVATPGLNIEGHCENKSCEAYKGGYLLIQWGYRYGGVFDSYIDNVDCCCPMCGGYVQPTNFGFWNTNYKVAGLKKTGKGQPSELINTPWKLIPEEDGYTTFKDSDDNMANWIKLIITVKRP